jgi:FkbM family methyltransferase
MPHARRQDRYAHWPGQRPLPCGLDYSARRGTSFPLSYIMRGMAVTYRRRILSLLPRVGLRAHDVSPGVVVLSRTKTRVEVSQLNPGTALVLHRATARRHRHDQDKAVSSYLATEQIMHVLSLYKANCVLDVGANKGQYAQALRRAGYRGWIVSFEPVPRDFELLAQRAAKDGKWTAHCMALGREDDTIAMNVVPGTLSSLLPATPFGSKRYQRLQEPTSIDVQVRRLDGVLDEVTAHVPGVRPYLKLDTQGSDLEAFAGCAARVEDLVGMQSEVALLEIYEGMPRMPQAIAVYEEAGFEITGLYPVSRERRTARVLEFDCIMARASTR